MTKEMEESLDHSQLIGLIPWYVKGTLNQSDQALLKEHLKHCELCLEEVLSCETLATSLPLPAETWKPSAAHFSGIMAQIDKLEAAVIKEENPLDVTFISKPKPKLGFFQHLGNWLSQTPSPVRWTLAVETLAVAALALLVILPMQPKLSSGGTYETLSDTETSIESKNEASIRLVFAEDMTTKELSDLLKHAKAQMQQGPSAVGSYTVSVAAGEKDESLNVLRSNPKVRLAQPIEPMATE